MKGLKEIILAILLGAVIPSLLLRFMNVPAQQKNESITVAVQCEDSVVSISIEEYVQGVLLAEMPPEFHLEALKAQAVAARTFALYCKNHGSKHKGADICTSASCCQGYLSPEEFILSGGTSDVVAKMQEAVTATKDKVLYYNDSLIEATYFASSGGWTENAEEVWGTFVPYLCSVESTEGDNIVETVMEEETFCHKLNVPKTGLFIESPTYTRGGGISSVKINGVLFTGSQLRQLLNLRSTVISFSAQSDGVHIITNGHGHRVGMSQYGADAMAEQGSGYREILKHYYTGVAIKNYGSQKN